MKTQPTAPIYLSMANACRAAGVTYKTLRLWTDTYGLPVITIGGIKRIKRADLEQFLDSYKKPVA
ncbi:helix-turn-helix domain-containing protein [Lactiplantibacillus plajomi]|jgi:excisionase family DNA binding protein|uniref:Helix-turn-helix domain-containing protein n=1 Tax=Lactiplantibacillus plajomi TaxID=1457217 RepID=A0ABV6K4P7_9LACO|nr:helix-turn-helix domain-containing protein [Lactiplantibacillus plajomi]